MHQAVPHKNSVMFLFLYSLCTTVSTQVLLPCLTSPHVLILTKILQLRHTHAHWHTHKHTCSSNYVSCIIQKEVASSRSAVQRGCPPPVKHDKRAMLRPDRAIWAVTLQPAIPHKEYIDTLQALEQSDTHKMEIVTCTDACGVTVRAMRGEISGWKCTCATLGIT